MNSPTFIHTEAHQTAPVTENSIHPSSSLIKPALRSSVNEQNVLQLMNELAKANKVCSEERQRRNLSAAYLKVTAQYALVKESGPPHCKQFEVLLTLANETYTGTGTSIKRAQQVGQ